MDIKDVSKNELQAILTVGLIVVLVLSMYLGTSAEVQNAIIGVLLAKFGLESAYILSKKVL